MDSEVLEDEFDGPAFEFGSSLEQRRQRCLRKILGGVVIIVVVVIILSVVLTHQKQASAASTSRLIEFQLGNLDGDDSHTGSIFIRTIPEWAPIGVDRFHDLVASDFFTDCRFFRVLPGFVAQFGINGDPFTELEWRNKPLMDDPVVASNVKGTITFATAGNNTRTSQLFINLDDNVDLDRRGFAPIGEIVRGMDIVERIYSKWQQQPDQKQIIAKGNSYLLENFPGLTYIIAATPSLD